MNYVSLLLFGWSFIVQYLTISSSKFAFHVPIDTQLKRYGNKI